MSLHVSFDPTPARATCRNEPKSCGALIKHARDAGLRAQSTQRVRRLLKCRKIAQQHMSARRCAGFNSLSLCARARAPTLTAVCRPMRNDHPYFVNRQSGAWAQLPTCASKYLRFTYPFPQCGQNMVDLEVLSSFSILRRCE